MTSSNHIMKVSSNGQVSIPAVTRARWDTRRVVVVDLGDRLVIRPLSDDPVGSLLGKYEGRGPDLATARADARTEEAASARRRER